MHIVLYFGSFNPIHTGHLMIASAVVDRAEVDQLWFVVSPQNPFKKEDTLWDEQVRLNLVKEAIKDDQRLACSDIEFSLSKPSYTIHTLEKLKEEYPMHQFSILIGSDNLAGLPKWKDYDQLIEEQVFYVYPRLNHALDDLNHPNLKKIECPYIELSATYIRSLIQQKKSVKYIVPPNVEAYIQQHFYQIK